MLLIPLLRRVIPPSYIASPVAKKVAKNTVDHVIHSTQTAAYLTATSTLNYAWTTTTGLSGPFATSGNPYTVIDADFI